MYANVYVCVCVCMCVEVIQYVSEFQLNLKKVFFVWYLEWDGDGGAHKKKKKKKKKLQ